MLSIRTGPSLASISGKWVLNRWMVNTGCAELGAVSEINRTVFQLSFPQVLFHRPFIGGASVMVPQCYMLLSLCMLGTVQSLNVFIFTLLCVQIIYFSNGN